VSSRARALTGVALVGLALRLVACSTSGAPATQPEPDGAPGESFTACEINGYIPELDSGGCPEGTCLALAFDTNGGQLACCTSIATGPGPCADAAEDIPAAEAADDAAPEAGPADAPADTLVVDGGGDAPTDAIADVTNLDDGG
jgi:hypothetical protein